jgi:hypothetical protein
MLTVTAVVGNSAVTTPLPALWLTFVAPATVKAFAATPLRVNPALAVKVMVAVYTVLEAKVLLTAGLQLTEPVYWSVSVTAVTGEIPAVGAVTPGIASMLTVTAVVGNSAVTTPLPALWLTLVAPATVKAFAATPLRVNPALAVKVMVAVYTVLAAKVPLTAGLQLTVPVYWSVSVTAVTGATPVTGAVTPARASMLTVAAVTGNSAATTPLSALWLTLVAPATVKLFVATPLRVNPGLAVRVMVAVYTVPTAKVPLTAGLQLTVPVYWGVSVIVVTGVAPKTGAATPGIASRLMVAAAVAGNTAVTTPLSALWLTLVAPATVKLFVATPLRVNPVLAVRVIVAVYTVLPVKVPLTSGLQLTIPVY